MTDRDLYEQSLPNTGFAFTMMGDFHSIVFTQSIYIVTSKVDLRKSRKGPFLLHLTLIYVLGPYHLARL